MGPLRRTPLIAVIGGLAVLAPVTTTVPAYAVTTPGQDVRNDYGQSDAEVAVEIARAVDATPAVVAARSTAAAAHRLALARTATEAKARGAYRSAVRHKHRKAAARALRAYRPAHKRAVAARAADAAAKAACARTVAATTAAVRATHYRPVDGTYDGRLVSYLVPTTPKISFEPLQVRITVYGGHLSDISVIAQAPERDSNSYNVMSLSTLCLEAMSSGDKATVAAVSGASLTSEAFEQSLQAALVAAGFKA